MRIYLEEDFEIFNITTFSLFLNPIKIFPGGSDSEESVCNEGDPGSVPGLGNPGSVPGFRSPGESNGNPLQYSCLENPLDRGA